MQLKPTSIIKKLIEIIHLTTELESLHNNNCRKLNRSKTECIIFHNKDQTLSNKNIYNNM